MATTRRKPEARTYPPGTLLLDLTLRERAVPWRAPMIGQGRPVKDTRLIAWQRIVALHAAIERRENGLPYEGPVSVMVAASFRKGPLPDATNILKAIEDALEGVVFANDRQVGRNGCERYMGGYDMVTIEVRAIEPGGIGGTPGAGA